MFKFLKQFLLYGFGSVLGKIAAIFLLPLYTNVLSQEEFGAMAMIAASKGIIELFSNLNIHSGVARDYYEKSINRKTLISTGFFSILFFSILLYTLIFFSKNFWISTVLNVDGYEKAFAVMLLTLPSGSLFTYFTVLIRYQQKVVLYSIGTILQLIIQISLTIYFILIIKTGIVGVFYGVLGGEILGILFFFFLNRENVRFKFNHVILKRVLAFSLPTLPAILAAWIDNSTGQLLIGKYISLNDAGIYSISLKIASVFLLIRTALGNVWHPFVFENYNLPEFNVIALKIFEVATIVLIIISVNLALLSDQIILLLSNPDYIVASDYLIILTIPMSISVLAWFAGIGPFISRKTKYISYAEMSGSIVNLALLIVFLPIYGVITVPVSLGISRVLSFSLASYFTFKEISLLFPFRNIIILIITVMVCYLIKQIEFRNIYIFMGLIFVNSITIIILYNHYNIKGLILAKSKKN